MTYILLNRLKSLLSGNVTKPSIDAEVINPTEQNFQKIQLGLSDGTKDINVSSLTAATTDAGALSVDSLDLNGNIDASSQATNISLIDNNASALDIKEATNSYLKFDTTNGAEKISIGKTLDINSSIDVATQATTISIKDNEGASLDFKEAANSYLTLDTTNGAERILASKIIEADGGINLDGNLDASTQATTVSIKDNEASALDIAEGANSYIKCTTTNGSEAIALGKNTNITGNAYASGDIYTEALLDIGASSTVTGWSSFTSKNIYGKKIGKTCFIKFDIAGTSNSTSCSFTIPWTSVGTITYFVIRSYNNGTTYDFGVGYIAASSSTVTLTRTSSGSSWTNANGKAAQGEFFFEATA